jgi:Domain of unknown function (DUF5615)
MDENVVPAYAKQMRRKRSDLVIWTVGELGAPGLGTLDPEILIWCEEYDFILVTNNCKSMPGHLRDHIAANRHMPGIFLLNPEFGIGQNIDELLLIVDGSLDGEYQDQIIHLPLT